jgi:hypothetical protein
MGVPTYLCHSVAGDSIMKSITTLTTAVACALALTACGGGGDDSASPGSDSGSNPGSSSTGGATPLVFSYEAQPVATDANSFLALLNSEGARGYRYLSDKTFSDGTKSIFLNDGMAPTYACEMLAPPTDYAAQANTEGAKGYFAFDTGNNFPYNFYCQGSGAAVQYIYSYASDVVPSSTSDFIDQLNQWGKSGYYINGQVIDVNSNIVFQTSYEKNTISTPNYTYALLTPQTDLNNYVSQLNSEGAQGYRGQKYNLLLNYAPYNVYGSGMDVMVYMKDQSQSATFTYLTDTPPTTSAAFIAQANSYGTQNYGYIGEVTLSGQPVSFYFKANNCTGFICAGLTWMN